MSDAPRAPAATLVVFGGGGDLAKRLLAPALVNLASAGLLDEGTRVIGIGRSDDDDASLRKTLGEFVKDPEAYGWLEKRVHYLRGDITEHDVFAELAKTELKNAVFYLAIAPRFFGDVVESLADAGLLDETDGFRRIVVEKPFGTDLASAQALNARILARVPEAQVFRIDHFLGKETVQNIMVLRFGNPMLEAVWNSRYIDHVQITAAEAVDVGARGDFYDATGALRDMTPNHLFQLLSLVAMEPPNGFDAESIRNEKAKVLAAVRPVAPADAVRGRYGAGEVAGRRVTPYLEADDVKAHSSTETYAALKIEVATWRWAGVPFYLRTGKAVSARDTEIAIQFRQPALALFSETGGAGLEPNRLVLQLQPGEALDLGLTVKTPGPRIEGTPVAMRFAYADRFDVTGRTGYETLLYDVLMGDATLFQRADQIEGGWRAIQPVLDAWAKGQPHPYAAGSAGPPEADELMARDGRSWHALG